MTKEIKLVSPGAILKELRSERGLKLSDISELTGIPVSTLSKIERGKSELTMDRLLKIGVALDVNVADVLRAPSADHRAAPRSRRSITRIGDIPKIKSSYGQYSYPAQDLLEKRMSPIIAEIRAKTLEEFGDFHRHDGEEYVFVLDGELAFYTDTYTPVHLKQGESIYFDSSMGHAYIAEHGPCRLLLVCSPLGNLPFVEGASSAAELRDRPVLLTKDDVSEP